MGNKTGTKRRQFWANAYHKELFFVVFLAALIPTLITTIMLFYLIFNIVAEQAGIPELIAQTVYPAANKVIRLLVLTVPPVLFIIFIIAYKITHAYVGSYGRILRELDERMRDNDSTPIVVRQKDRFRPLVHRINWLLKKKSS